MINPSPLILFYSHHSPDSCDRTLRDIWQQDYQWLEKTHDYIQWLFPLPEGSRFNVDAPILSDNDILLFKKNSDLQNNLLNSLKLMLGFYGLQCETNNEDEIKISKTTSFLDRKQNWIHWGNHNHLRITRILKSLCLLGQKKYADSFLECLREIYLTEKGEITSLTFDYWQKAVS